MIEQLLPQLCFCGSISCFAGLGIDFVCPIGCCVPSHSPVICVSRAFVLFQHRWKHLLFGGQGLGGKIRGGELRSATGEGAREKGSGRGGGLGWGGLGVHSEQI